MIRSRRVAATLMGIYVLVVAAIVFAPTADVPSESVTWMSAVLIGSGAPSWVTPGVMEFVTNVLLFIPLSFLGATFRPLWGWWSWLVAGLGFTLAIELGQMLFLPGRSPQSHDVVANTIGAVAGYAPVAVARRREVQRSSFTRP